MWHNQCMMDLFQWAKRLEPEATPDLFGIDCYSLFESKRAVIRFLETHDPEFAAEVRDRLAYLDKFKSGFEYGDWIVRGDGKHISGHIQDVLTKIQARLQWGSDKYDCTDSERLSAEQNCEVVIAADEYYRKCISEPRGSQASWNARDQHMTTTLLRIQAHLKDPKIVLWAHNSHIGDSTATRRGGVNFEANETWNLGQMVRATFGADNVWIVGQYTYNGHVMAAQHWGGPHKARKLKDALPESYEACLHQVQRHLGTGDPFYFACRAFAGPHAPGADRVRAAVEARHPVALALVAMLKDKPQRLQRWVGVSYKRDTERQSHYGELALDRCYDQIVFVDKTAALGKIQPKAAPPAAAWAPGDGVPDEGGGGGGAGGGAGGGNAGSGVTSTRSVNKRLLKEYRRLMRSPPEGIEAHPLESNILEWHFVLRASQYPYAGGEYHGTLVFPKEYPMRPPRFKVMTPSGRFKPGARLCLSMSDYHPESWNPAWSVETCLVGLLSFMYEESNAIGSINASARERERLAKASHKYNRRDKVWCELFGDGAQVLAVDDDDDDEVTGASVCRFCFGSDGDLISPCMCKGSNEPVAVPQNT